VVSRAGAFGVESVLLVHDDYDRNVPFQQTTDFVEKLRAQNVAVEEAA
jgi:dipeptidyl aminopeptidase/acylaminoacyl peptidase